MHVFLGNSIIHGNNDQQDVGVIIMVCFFEMCMKRSLVSRLLPRAWTPYPGSGEEPGYEATGRGGYMNSSVASFPGR